MTIFLETKVLPTDVVAWISMWMAQGIPFDVPDGCIAYTITLTFRDGLEMDIDVINGYDGHPSWVDYNLYIPGEGTVDCGPYEEYTTSLLGSFELYHEGNTYIANLVTEVEGKGACGL